VAVIAQIGKGRCRAAGTRRTCGIRQAAADLDQLGHAPCAVFAAAHVMVANTAQIPRQLPVGHQKPARIAVVAAEQLGSTGRILSRFPGTGQQRRVFIRRMTPAPAAHVVQNAGRIRGVPS